MGAWIETQHNLLLHLYRQSHPVWVRGLKPEIVANELAQMRVAPRVGAWIETADASHAAAGYSVAPRVGAWIETGTP